MEGFFVIEGMDGSGKSTLVPLLEKALREKGFAARALSFPNYGSPPAKMIEAYLGGELGDSGQNPYAVSAMYALDRFFVMKGEDFAEAQILLSARYVSSNLIYQLPKLPREQWEEFALWLEDLEYQKFALPRPDAVFFLDMPRQEARKLLEHRYEKGGEADIHERDEAYLAQCERAARFAVKRGGFETVNCVENGRVLTPAEMTEKLLAAMEPYLPRERKQSDE